MHRKNFSVPFLLAGAMALGAMGVAAAQTTAELKKDQGTPGDVLVYGMGQHAQRCSPLTTINTDNLKKLVPKWS